jgi:hypothetical protein
VRACQKLCVWGDDDMKLVNNTLIIVLSNNGKEIERATAADGRCAVKVALLMLAKRDALALGDTLRVDANADQM